MNRPARQGGPHRHGRAYSIAASASIDQLLRARLLEIDTPRAYCDGSRSLFRAALGACLARRTAL
jgi:hypothetical protein